MRQFDSLPSMLENSTALYSQFLMDPIFTPLFTAILGTGGFTIGATTITYASVAAAIATTALSIGLQALLAPKPPKPEDGKVPRTQAVPFRQWGVGRNRVGGAFMLWEAKGKNLFAVQAIAGHRIKSVNRFWLHDDEVTLQPDGTIQEGTNYSTRVKILSRLGLVPETAYAPIVEKLSADGVWTNAHRGDGQASIAMIAESVGAERQNKRFPYGPPQLSVEADMALCWDFRDPLQDPENPDTWVWTKNTALQMCWHQCFNEFGHRRDYRRAILPLLEMWQEEADICDELIPLKGGGFERRYESSGFDTTENDPKAGTSALLAACDGWICERGDGALQFIVGKFREKYVTTITDADITGHQVEYDVLFEDECNRLVPKFTYPEIGYATSDTDFFEDVDAQITAGRVLAQDAIYQWVQQWRQARRLGKRDWLRLQQKLSGTLNLRLSGINAVYSRWVRMNTPLSLPRLNGKIVENRKSLLSLMQGAFSMDIMLHPDNIDAWNPTTDEGKMPPVPPKTGKGDVVVPVINLVQAKPNGESVYIRVVIIDPEDDTLVPVVRYRVADDGTGNPGAWVEQRFPNATPSGGFVNLNTNVVPSDKLLDIQVAFIASDNDYGDWSVTANVTSTVGGYDADATAIFSAMSVAPNNTRKRLINNLVVDLKSAGVWSLLTKIVVPAAHSEQAGLLNWKAPGGTPFAKVGTINFAADLGFTGDGTSGHLDSGTAWTAIASQDSASMWAWSLTNVDANAAILGTTTSGGNAFVIPRTGGNFNVRANGLSVTIDALASSIGFFGWSRASSSAFSGYRNKTKTDVTQASAAAPTGNMTVARTGGGYASQQIAFAAAGSSLTQTQQNALYDAVREYLRGVGAL